MQKKPEHVRTPDTAFHFGQSAIGGLGMRESFLSIATLTLLYCKVSAWQAYGAQRALFVC